MEPGQAAVSHEAQTPYFGDNLARVEDVAEEEEKEEDEPEKEEAKVLSTEKVAGPSITLTLQQAITIAVTKALASGIFVVGGARIYCGGDLIYTGDVNLGLCAPNLARVAHGFDVVLTVLGAKDDHTLWSSADPDIWLADGGAIPCSISANLAAQSSEVVAPKAAAPKVQRGKPAKRSKPKAKAKPKAKVKAKAKAKPKAKAKGKKGKKHKLGRPKGSKDKKKRKARAPAKASKRKGKKVHRGRPKGSKDKKKRKARSK